MNKKLSIITVQTLLGLTLLGQNLSALTLNGTEVNFAKSTEKSSRSLSIGDKTIVVKFNSPLDNLTKEKFYNQGVEQIVYAGDLSYYFYAKASTLNRLSFDTAHFVGKSDMRSSYRYKDESGLSILNESAYQSFNVLFLSELTAYEVREYLSENGISANIKKVIPELKEAEIEVSSNDVEKLKNLPLIQYMDRSVTMKAQHGEKESRNEKTSGYTNVSKLWGSSYKLNGENMKIGIVDGGVVRDTHREFNKDGLRRVINKSNSETNFHATHVAGTIIAEGDRASARGMANGAVLYSYAFSDVAFAESFLKLYNDDDVLLSNHSYGYSDKIRMGEYDSEASTQDRAISNNPFINVFEAAGNDGKISGYADYGIIKGPANSKNILTIGALNSNSTGVAELSSTGPVKDGRIKPDLCVRGEYINSTSDESDSSYATMSGTSMATPAATGAAALIIQEYKRVTDGFDIRHDVLKSIMINTAIDRENKGPDYKVGFGMINAKAAVDEVKSLLLEDSSVTIDLISNNNEKVYAFKQAVASSFKTTISWVDKEANPSASETLVNDIDMLLVEKNSGKKYYPYTLNKNIPSALAKTDKPNRVDNIEQIEVLNLPAGDYELIVKGYKIITQNQEFAIASNKAIFKKTIKTLRPSKIRSFVQQIHREIL